MDRLADSCSAKIDHSLVVGATSSQTGCESSTSARESPLSSQAGVSVVPCVIARVVSIGVPICPETEQEHVCAAPDLPRTIGQTTIRDGSNAHDDSETIVGEVSPVGVAALLSPQEHHRSLLLEDVALLTGAEGCDGWDIVDAAGTIIREMNSAHPPDLWSVVVSQLYKRHPTEMSALEDLYRKKLRSKLCRGKKAARLGAQLKRNCLTRAGFAIRTQTWPPRKNSVPEDRGASGAGNKKKPEGLHQRFAGVNHTGPLRNSSAEKEHKLAKIAAQHAMARAEQFASETAKMRGQSQERLELADKTHKPRVNKRCSKTLSTCTVRPSRHEHPGETVRKRMRTDKVERDGIYSRLYERMASMDVSEELLTQALSDKELRVIMKTNGMLINKYNPITHEYSEKTKGEKVRELIPLIGEGQLAVPQENTCAEDTRAEAIVAHPTSGSNFVIHVEKSGILRGVEL